MPKIAASERDAFYEARREALSEIALKLWAKDGFDKTSVAEITRAAGISKGTFYLYYDSKDALLADVLRRNSLVPNILALTRDLQTTSLEDAVRGFVQGSWRHLAEHRDLVLLVVRELPSQLDRARSLVEEIMVPGNQLLASYLEARIPEARAQEISTIVSVRALIGMVVMMFFTQEILGAGEFIPVAEEDIVQTITELFLRGIAPESGGVPR